MHVSFIFSIWYFLFFPWFFPVLKPKSLFFCVAFRHMFRPRQLGPEAWSTPCCADAFVSPGWEGTTGVSEAGYAMVDPGRWWFIWWFTMKFHPVFRQTQYWWARKKKGKHVEPRMTCPSRTPLCVNLGYFKKCFFFFPWHFVNKWYLTVIKTSIVYWHGAIYKWPWLYHTISEFTSMQYPQLYKWILIR